MHCSTHRADLLNALSLSLTKWLVSTDEDEVSGKFSLLLISGIPSSNLLFCDYEVIVVYSMMKPTLYIV